MGQLPLLRLPNTISRKASDALASPEQCQYKAQVDSLYSNQVIRLGVLAMDLAQRAKSVETALESGQGCSATRLLSDLSPAERLAVLKQAVADNQMKAADGVPILDFSAAPPNAPLTEADKIIWVTKQSRAKTEAPVKLLGFNDLTVLPCKNAR